MGKDSIYCKYIKCTIDRVLAVVGLSCFWWLYLLIMLAIKFEDPKGPVIFKQERLGKDGKVYYMYKFRSMKVGAEHTGMGVYSDDNDPRITHVGKFIRKTSLDEIPQLINILKGDMCLIGYRSPLTYHPWSWEEYTDDQKKMFDVRPGITGWAQVHGRKLVEWHRRIELNVWYAEHVSFLLDMKIFLLTIGKVLTNADNKNVGSTISEEYEIKLKEEA